MQCLFYVYKIRSQDSPATEFSNALVPGKKASKAGRSDYLIYLLFFLYGNSGESNRIFSDVFLAYNEKEIQHRQSLSFKLQIG